MATRRGAALLILAFVVVAALILAATVTGYRVSTLATSLARLAGFTSVIQKDVKAADLDAVAKDLVKLDSYTQQTLVAASDPILSGALDGLPVAGPHLEAVRTLAAAAAGLTSAAKPLSTILPKLDPKNLVSGGRYDVASLTALDTEVKSLGAQIAVSNKQISSIDTTGLNSRLVSVITKTTTALDGATDLLNQLEPLVKILPIVIGGSGEKTWFVALQNLTEMRGTGGLLGAYSVLDVNNGKITMTASGSDKDLEPTPVATTGLPSDFVDIWQPELVEYLDMNVSPHFPYTGQLISNAWTAHSGQDVDGVLAFGQGIVQYMLSATGPLTIDGTVIDASNVVKFLSIGVYQKYPDVADKNEFVAKLVAEIFTRLQNGQFDLESVLSATAVTPTSDRVQAWSPDADLENQITDAGIDGVIPDTYGPTAAVAINNGGGNKLEQFLTVKIDYSLGACNADPADYGRAATMTITLTNNAPASGLPNYVAPRVDIEQSGGEPQPVGSNLEVVSIYAPVDAEDGTATLDDQEIDDGGYIGDDRNRPLYVFGVDLDPGQTRTLVVPWTEPTVGPDVVNLLGAQPSVITQPSLNPITVTTPAATACR